MNTEYRRDISHNYMILETEEAPDTDSYRVRMVLANDIPGLLHCELRNIDGSARFYYEISSQQALKTLVGQGKHAGTWMLNLYRQVLHILEQIAQYLLPADDIVLSPEHIYLEPERMTPKLCYLPGYGKDIYTSFRELMEYLLPAIDHSDKQAVSFYYGLYKQITKGGCTLVQLKETVKRAGRQAAHPSGAPASAGTGREGAAPIRESGWNPSGADGYPTRTGMPAAGGYPAQEGVPAAGGYPAQEGVPAAGGYPAQEGVPAADGYPAQGGVPVTGDIGRGNFAADAAGYPGRENLSGTGSYAGQEDPSGTGSYPGREGRSGTGGYPGREGCSGTGGYPGQEGCSGTGVYPGQEGYPGTGGYPGQEGYPGAGYQAAGVAHGQRPATEKKGIKDYVGLLVTVALVAFLFVLKFIGLPGGVYTLLLVLLLLGAAISAILYFKEKKQKTKSPGEKNAQPRPPVRPGNRTVASKTTKSPKGKSKKPVRQTAAKDNKPGGIKKWLGSTIGQKNKPSGRYTDGKKAGRASVGKKSGKKARNEAIRQAKMMEAEPVMDADSRELIRKIRESSFLGEPLGAASGAYADTGFTGAGAGAGTGVPHPQAPYATQTEYTGNGREAAPPGYTENGREAVQSGYMANDRPMAPPGNTEVHRQRTAGMPEAEYAKDTAGTTVRHPAGAQPEAASGKPAPLFGETQYLGTQEKGDTNTPSLICADGGKIRHLLNMELMLVGKLKDAVDIELLHTGVSRIHAKIRKENGSFILEDLNSKNGTFINERLLEGNEEVSLKDGDLVSFAGCSYRFCENS